MKTNEQKNLVKAFQYQHGDLVIDGIYGEKTKLAVDLLLASHSADYEPFNDYSRFSKLDYSKVARQFPLTSSRRMSGISILDIPEDIMVLAWNTNIAVSAVSMRTEAAKQFVYAICEAHSSYSKKDWLEGGLNLYGGSYNHRKVRGSSHTWSMHAYGLAFDIDPLHNPMGTHFDDSRMGSEVCGKFVKIMAEHGFKPLEHDPMHFEYQLSGYLK